VIRRFAAASAALIVFSELCACSHGGTLACEPTSRYAAAATIGPVRIPDDLNPPDETDSLRLPPDTGRAAQSSKPCLETPPGFYADGAANNPRGGGQRRTGKPAPAPRQAAPPPTAAPAPTNAPAPAPESPPPAAAPAPPSTEQPAPGGDREITN
jgi:hypothetical protein